MAPCLSPASIEAPSQPKKGTTSMVSIPPKGDNPAAFFSCPECHVRYRQQMGHDCLGQPRKFKVGDKVQTLQGRPARILADDAMGEQPLVVLIFDADGVERPSLHCADGRYYAGRDFGDSDYDLVPLPPAPEVDPKLEAVARAMCETDGVRPDDRSVMQDRGQSKPMWHVYLHPAKLWIAAWRAYCSTEAYRG